MKELPLNCTSEEVRGILEGRKTQTRRIIKPQPDAVYSNGNWYPDRYNKTDEWCFWGKRGTPDHNRCGLPLFKAPLGPIGRRLWVREAWRVGSWRDDGRVALDYKASPEIIRTPWLYPPEIDFKKLAKQGFEDCKKAGAKFDRNTNSYKWEHGKSPCRWRPPLFMPRWASRITLEVIDIRVQRIQDISRNDAKEEGFWPSEFNGLEHWEGKKYGNAQLAFQACWDSIHGPDSWDQNPFVLAYTFKRVKGEAT